ncbi:response regulator transcription factor [Rothia sp. AR01]|uniref:Response regulator transcription factor n=1 Tax=Rothia santali TaxID=2949643 RepID=A0A9X2KHR6_9MICC|nr:response regulator transcription factor [Rothia santali]MCP3425200.1 response regulator transcription factor [Rothia santali]
MIRILIADDQEMIRIGLKAVLEASDDLDILDTASDGIEAVKKSLEYHPDVILMDIRMPGIDGVEATQRIRESHTSTETPYIIMLTTFDDDQNVFAALRAGAVGFLNKGLGPVELVRGIREVVDGGGALSANAASTLIAHAAETPPPRIDTDLHRLFTGLTARERQIVLSAARGDRNDQIAIELHLSPFTVKTHLNRAMTKVGAHDRAQLIAFAYRAGLTP